MNKSCQLLLQVPQEDWKWEECNIPICELNCTRPGFNIDLPICKEYTEPNPLLQATVALFSGSLNSRTQRTVE